MIRIKDYPTDAPEGVNKKDIEKKTSKIAKKIGLLAGLMQAENKHNLLVVFQGMDASGKDGTTREVFKYCSPSIAQAVSFKKPTNLEFAHDFLWRVHAQSPSQGTIKIFNRSHYEDVLIQRVHNWINDDRVDARFEAINAFEKLIQVDNNTTILKFFMNISPERQLEKLKERKVELRKMWKHNDGDWEERKLWDKYVFCYEEVLNRSEIPWIIAPVDQRWYRNYFVAKKVLETLEGFDMSYPTLK